MVTGAQKGEGPPLVLHVLDWDRFGRSDILGEAQITARLWRRGFERVEVPLKQQEVTGTTSRSNADKLASGVIVVSCEWADGRHAGGIETNDEAGSAVPPVDLPEGNAAEMPPPPPTSEGAATPSLPPSGGRQPGAAPAAVPAAAAAAAPAPPPLGPCEVFVRVFEGRDFATADRLSKTGDSLVKVRNRA